ncbi:MAG: ACP S-malonyltransferase [Cucumibacter sp.]
MPNRALTFPGQGSQAVGMGVALAAVYPSARAVFAEVDEALGEKLSALMEAGPEETLRLTENAQPALMAVSMAVVRVLEAEGASVPKIAKFVAGHSLGEYSALCAAGSIGIADAARLLRIRGRAMQQAVPVGQGAMAALLGLENNVAEQVARDAAQGQVCEIANDNAPFQVVVSGHAPAVERAIGLARESGVRRAILLPVSAPFHCSLMGPAAEVMRAALADVKIGAPCVPLVANVIAAPLSDPGEIRRRLVEQVTARVRWRESILWMIGAGGITELVELGAGKVLTGLARRMAGEDRVRAVAVPDEIVAFLAAIRAGA